MASNSIGNILRLTTFGESHGPAIGGVLDGFPPEVHINLDFVTSQLNRRRPGQSDITTPRSEGDNPEFLSGIFENKTLGTPIAWIIRNHDQRSEDYTELKNLFRPGHADFTYFKKYGHRDYRGGGRSSARETANWVVAGSLANQLLTSLYPIEIKAWVSRIGEISYDKVPTKEEIFEIENSKVRCPDNQTSKKMIERIHQAKNEGDSLGGAIRCMIWGVPAGWGDPVFEKLHANLAKSMMSINAVKAYELGSGIGGTQLTGSKWNDPLPSDSQLSGLNNSGGILGGISSGATISFSIHFKPTSTISKPSDMLDSSGSITNKSIQGRHDPCVVPRAIPIVESLTALVLGDAYLFNKSL
jgi:chorismate synthase